MFSNGEHFLLIIMKYDLKYKHAWKNSQMLNLY